MNEPRITITVAGQEARPADLGDPMRALLASQMRVALGAKLRGVVCPEHGQAPDVTITFAGGQQHVAVQGCCKALIDRTMSRLLHPDAP